MPGSGLASGTFEDKLLCDKSSAISFFSPATVCQCISTETHDKSQRNTGNI